MERSRDRLLSDLREGGILIPPPVSSIETLTTQDLFSICAQCVNWVVGSDSFGLVPPEPVAEKVGACGELAVAVRKLGFIGEMGFDKLLYPSVEDTRELLRFLAGRVAEKLPFTQEAVDVQIVGLKKMMVDETLEKGGKPESSPYSTMGSGGDEEEELLEESMNDRMASVRLRNELELLKAAKEMASDSESSSDSILEKLQEQINDKRRKLSESELQRNALEAALQEKRRSLEESVYSTRPELAEKLQELKRVDLELDNITNEVRRKERERRDLSAKLKKPKKQEPRISYIRRIEEITKNSRKQEADVERILGEIRELQLESNVIQERLHRTYALLDETVFREAKKDRVGREAYRLLTSIHESFEQVSDKLLSSDRVQREIAGHEKKLAAMASRRINMGALQADIDAITKENERLTQHLETSM
ncbi:hypothetical protein MLD38_022112 [Melastoma candidum]|uniref:Uncharacterized protein n=1 Tax=Melastoma candidum TaxID=119954 RepID=A0ACB9QI46_9MYRT|nr:hypothetical protein MLD38_022112 [Melastoma candidum]